MWCIVETYQCDVKCLGERGSWRRKTRWWCAKSHESVNEELGLQYKQAVCRRRPKVQRRVQKSRARRSAKQWGWPTALAFSGVLAFGVAPRALRLRSRIIKINHGLSHFSTALTPATTALPSLSSNTTHHRRPQSTTAHHGGPIHS